MKLRNRKHFGYTTTESGTKEALTMIIPDGMARIYFYRVDDISGLSSGSDPAVFVDDVEVIRLPNRTFSYLDVKPTEHKVKLKLIGGNQKDIVSAKLNIGEVQYIKASASGALGAASLIVTTALLGPMVVSSFKLSTIEKSLALDELQKLKLVKLKGKEVGPSSK